eukprot:5295332-Pyramimonas_sp.AAC.1
MAQYCKQLDGAAMEKWEEADMQQFCAAISRRIRYIAMLCSRRVDSADQLASSNNQVCKSANCFKMFFGMADRQSSVLEV